MNAAVSDYKVENPHNGKVKKEVSNLNLELVPTVDILDSIKTKTNAKLVGFALELENGEENALKKLKSKKLDFIILNTANNLDQGFDVDTNQVTIFSKSGEKSQSSVNTKDRIANFIWNNIIN